MRIAASIARCERELQDRLLVRLVWRVKTDAGENRAASLATGGDILATLMTLGRQRA